MQITPQTIEPLLGAQPVEIVAGITRSIAILNGGPLPAPTPAATPSPPIASLTAAPSMSELEQLIARKRMELEAASKK